MSESVRINKVDQDVVNEAHRKSMQDITSKYEDMKHSYMNLEEFGREREEIIAKKDELERDLKKERKER